MKKLIILFFLMCSFNSYAEGYDIFRGLKENKYESIEKNIKELNISDLRILINNKKKTQEIPNFINELFIRIVSFSTDKDLIIEAINLGADVNYKNPEKTSPLMFVSMKERPISIVKLLIDSGAEVNATNEYGLTPFMYSVLNDHIEIAKYLLQRGAKINKKDSSGETPLMHALRNNNLDIARYLIEAGADVTARDNRGNTALIYLLDRNIDAPDIVSKLIERGVAVNGYECKHPLDYAMICNLEKTEELLRKAGAKQSQLMRSLSDCKDYQKRTCYKY